MSQVTEMRCRKCLKLHETETFPHHACTPVTDDSTFRKLKQDRMTAKPKADPEYTVFLNNLEEASPHKYTLHFLV